ncbi:MAG: signal peptidase II [Opitutales bacterium]|nr:signal peptidase II [Opitutales bacterium]MCH8540251.1 signal peptidase II [Opitutales bacterium]
MAADSQTDWPDQDTDPTPIEKLFQRAWRYRIFWILALVIAVLDQFTKTWIDLTLPLGTYHPPERINVIEGFFHIVHVSNTGAAWGILQGWSWFLALFSIVCLVLIFIFRRTLHLSRKPCQWAFGLLVGGVIGNLVDRVLRGHVIDFLDFHLGSYAWPAFNIADAGIFCGVAIYLYYSFFLEHHYPPHKPGRKKPEDPSS